MKFILLEQIKENGMRRGGKVKLVFCLPTFGLRLVYGRNLSEKQKTQFTV